MFLLLLEKAAGWGALTRDIEKQPTAIFLQLQLCVPGISSPGSKSILGTKAGKENGISRGDRQKR